MISEDAVYSVIRSKIKKLRTNHPVAQKKLTQSELATAIGINRATLTNIEIGNQRPPLHLIYRICEHFSVELDKLLPPVELLVQATLPEEVEVIVGNKAQRVPPRIHELICQARSEEQGRV